MMRSCVNNKSIRQSLRTTRSTVQSGHDPPTSALDRDKTAFCLANQVSQPVRDCSVQSGIKSRGLRNSSGKTSLFRGQLWQSSDARQPSCWLLRTRFATSCDETELAILKNRVFPFARNRRWIKCQIQFFSNRASKSFRPFGNISVCIKCFFRDTYK